LWWQWFGWNRRWPFFRHQYVTHTIWRPGFVPYRLQAWQPDVSSWTAARFNFDLLRWATERGVRPTKAVIDLNTGSQQFWNTP
jgi:hypothetical protein